MITRFAMFEGTIHPEEESAFRAAVLDELLPKWQAFPGARAVRVTFTEEADAVSNSMARALNWNGLVF